MEFLQPPGWMVPKGYSNGRICQGRALHGPPPTLVQPASGLLLTVDIAFP